MIHRKTLLETCLSDPRGLYNTITSCSELLCSYICALKDWIGPLSYVKQPLLSTIISHSFIFLPHITQSACKKNPALSFQNGPSLFSHSFLGFHLDPSYGILYWLCFVWRKPNLPFTHGTSSFIYNRHYGFVAPSYKGTGEMHQQLLIPNCSQARSDKILFFNLGRPVPMT